MDSLIKSSIKKSLKFRPKALEKINCNHEDLIKYYRKDVMRYKQYNLNYEYIKVIYEIQPLLIMSWNVQFCTDIYGENNFNQIVDLINYQKPDIVFLQAILMNKIEKLCKKTNLNLNSYYVNKTTTNDRKKTNYFLTAIMTKNTVNVNYSYSKPFLNNSSSNDKRGYVVTQIFFENEEKIHKINLVNVHLNSIDYTEITRYKQMLEILNNENLTNLSLIIGGNFNSITKNDYDQEHWNWLLKNSHLNLDPICSSYLSLPTTVSDLLLENLNDAGGNHKFYTCWTGRRVDYLYHSDDIDIKHYSTFVFDASKHFPILALISPKKLI
jgi:endonuclease/exonuclease/phosphatase family metal-dependent hydrolase